MPFNGCSTWLFTVPVQVEELELTVVGETFNCLFQGRDVILTCSISGFPRPRILFDRNGERIIPGMPGFERITNISLDQVSIGLRHNCCQVYWEITACKAWESLLQKWALT
jgi:hypothetical protein